MALATLSFVALTGCRTATVYNVKDAPLVAATNKKLTTDDVQQAIIRAGASLGWIIKPVSPGVLEGILDVRKHRAVVTISFDLEKYSILYKDSENLKYDETDLSIHGNYNKWVRNLDNKIRVQLSTL